MDYVGGLDVIGGLDYADGLDCIGGVDCVNGFVVQVFHIQEKVFWCIGGKRGQQEVGGKVTMLQLQKMGAGASLNY